MSNRALELTFRCISDNSSDFFAARLMMPSLLCIEGKTFICSLYPVKCQNIRDVIARIIGILSTLVFGWSFPQINERIHVRLKIIKYAVEQDAKIAFAEPQWRIAPRGNRSRHQRSHSETDLQKIKVVRIAGPQEDHVDDSDELP